MNGLTQILYGIKSRSARDQQDFTRKKVVIESYCAKVSHRIESKFKRKNT